MGNESNDLRRALQRLPAPEPRPGFVDRALRNASEAHAAARPGPLRSLVSRWESWVGAAVGAALTAVIAVMVLRPAANVDDAASARIALALHEARDVDVLIDSERDLEDATIRVAVTGGVALDGFDDEHLLQWRADLRRGSNLLSLPLVARSVGKAQLIAVVEHQGRTRQVTLQLTVRPTEASES